MTVTITGFDTWDLRFPTSQHLDGSDAMNPDPDYSAAYVVLRTDSGNLCGHGMTFTIGRGNELCTAAIAALAKLLVGFNGAGSNDKLLSANCRRSSMLVASLFGTDSCGIWLS